MQGVRMNRLWYRKAAADWNSALPLGNGFMGAMCFGGTLIDRFQLNNDSIWWSGPLLMIAFKIVHLRSSSSILHPPSASVSTRCVGVLTSMAL